MKHLAIVSIGLAIFTIASAGCAKEAAPPKANADKAIPANAIASPSPELAEKKMEASDAAVKRPGDPRLTLELVLRNTAAFKGRRVRWFGKMAASESTGNGSIYTNTTVYVNNPDAASAKGFRNFAVEYKSSSSFPEHFGDFWIMGTIKGTKKIFTTITSPEGSQKRISENVPLLIDPEFEPVDEKKKND